MLPLCGRSIKIPFFVISAHRLLTPPARAERSEVQATKWLILTGFVKPNIHSDKLLDFIDFLKTKKVKIKSISGSAIKQIMSMEISVETPRTLLADFAKATDTITDKRITTVHFIYFIITILFKLPRSAFKI